ncbi:MAG: isoprenylcysteine carboxylmethyltransferase family protein [Methanomicrobiales archaeon]|nr:isoprenylcysteine carboxylmethyltransferase family protein [Methanomicrobiales archaeon]
MRDQPDLKKKTVLLRLAGGFVAVAALLFLPAGTLLFWQGWLYLAVLFVPLTAVLAYLIRRDPELLVRRMQLQEKEPVEKPIIAVASIFFLIVMMVPGLDFRFGWSHIPVGVVLASDIIVFSGYFIFFLTLRENSFASRIIEVMPGQKVITTGPYAVVRHPMYLGVILMALFTPPALGSCWGEPLVIPVVAMILLRIRNEEGVLLRELPGYRDYCARTPYRLVPLLW